MMKLELLLEERRSQIFLHSSFFVFCALMDEKTVHGVVFIGGKELFIYLPKPFDSKTY